ncbi:hypothetical protein A0H81_07416 [Grifola frondosa]|uniref:Arrestin C-terminal-like domain-containing protein n=1 Tax=Grifola frondosa TaxID=5627 RepID=A0A1C7M6G7_GRIFR|nr:hypothetical protein A0H81_07416 [Grifola frondosa]
MFQGPSLPPSNAVHPYPLPGEPSLPAHHYPARRGITTFLFQFPLPESSPSSIDFGSGLACVRYEVRASVSVSWKGENRLVTDKKQVDVAECFEEDFARVEPEGVIVGENGKIWMQGKVVGGFMIAGQPACIELQVKNHSSKKNTGLSVSLTRELCLPNVPPGEKPPLQISDTLTSVSFRGPEYIILPGAEGVANLVFNLPRNARGAKGGRRQGDEEQEPTTECLFEVRCVASIKLSMGIASKNITLDIPVTILHPAALSALPEPDSYAALPQPYGAPIYDAPLLYHPPTSPIPYLDRSCGSLLLKDIHTTRIVSAVVTLPLPPNISSQSCSSSRYSAAPVQRRADSIAVVEWSAFFRCPTAAAAHACRWPARGRAQEGKGERASRIAQHLRMSSRHRSASPPAHRFPVPEHAALGIPSAAAAGAGLSSASSLSSPQTHLPHPPAPTLSVAALPQGAVVAPRPMLSPKHSFCNDPFMQTTQVQTLERIAAEAERKNANMSVAGAALDLDVHAIENREKTLPTPPVPTNKGNIPAVRTRVRSLFPHDAHVQADETPRTPMLAAVASLKDPRMLGAGAGGLSGLDALEARLIAEVGTRKVEKNDRHADVRAVLPIAIPRAGDTADPLNDSAISSLTLPGVEFDEKTLRLGKTSDKGGDDDGEIASPKPAPGRSRERNRGSKESKNEGSSSGRKDKGRHSGKKELGKDEEVYHLRKTAQGRVAAWLGSIDPAVPPLPATPPPVEPNGIVPDTSNDAAQHRIGGGAVPIEDPSKQEPDLAAPNPRSSGFVPIGTLRADPSQRAAVTESSIGHTPVLQNPKPVQKVSLASPRRALFPPQPLDPEVRYDIRSARGGKGGIVTAVAAMWASAAQATEKPDSSRPAKTNQPRRIPDTKAQVPTNPPRKPVRPVPKPTRTTPSAAVAPAVSKPVSTTDFSARRARMIKSSSVPAVVSSSLATPMLSSTASLARSSPVSNGRSKPNIKLPPTISEAAPSTEVKPSSVKPPPTKGDLAFGQARLRELIKRYQGQANA